MSLYQLDDREERGDRLETRLGYRPCVSCEREHPKETLVDGWCPQCRAASYDEMAAEEKARLYRMVAAGWLAQGLDEQARLLNEWVDREYGRRS